MARSRGEARKPGRWLRADRVQRLRLPAESRGENRPHKPDAALLPGRCLQRPRALTQTAPQIDSLQLGPWEFPLSRIRAAQERSRKLAVQSRAGIFHRDSDARRECDPLTGDASRKLKCPSRSQKTSGWLP